MPSNSSKREIKVVELKGFKASEDGNGSFSGYANDFGILDSYGDITVAGCYAETLEQFKLLGWSTCDHSWGVKDEIGIITDAHEDEQGLFFTSEYHPTTDAQQIRAKVNNRLAKGKSVRLSIGYIADEVRYVSPKEALKYLTPQQQQDEQVLAHLKTLSRVRLLLKITLFEVSIVSVPAEPQASVTAAKSAASGFQLALNTAKKLTALKMTHAEKEKSAQLIHDKAAALLGLKCTKDEADAEGAAETSAAIVRSMRKSLSNAERALTKDIHAESAKMGAYCKDLNDLQVSDDEKVAHMRPSIKALFENALAARTNSLWNLEDVLNSCIWQVMFEDELAESMGTEFDLELALREILSEFTERVVASLLEEDEEEDSGADDSLAIEVSSLNDNERKRRQAVAAKFALAHSDQVVATVTEFVEKMKRNAANRTKEGRVLSDANRKKVQAAVDALQELLTASEPKSDTASAIETLRMSLDLLMAGL
jgi:phage head maturation protease